MREIFDTLKELQEVYSQKLALEKDIQEAHVRVESNKEILVRLKEKEIAISAKLDGVVKEEKSLKAQASEVEASREKTEFRIAEIKTQREYEALEKEIKSFSMQESSLRKELESVRRLREEVQTEREHLLALMQAQQEEIEKEAQLFETELKAKEQRLRKLGIQEKNLSKPLNDDLKFKFKRIVRKKNKSVVPLRNRVCSGCHILLPLQFVNEVRTETEIHFCPNCNRILYFEDVDSERETMDVSGGLADLVGDFE